jgi:diacylglycerol kinase family enzyme
MMEMEDTKVERICKDAIDLFLSTKLEKITKRVLEKITKRVTLKEAISQISETVIEYEDTTKIVREMREKKYDLLM